MPTKKFYIPIGLCLVLVLAIIFLSQQTRAPEAPITVYKTTQLSDRQKSAVEPVSGVDHGHDHSHDTTPHVHIGEASPSVDTYDWRDDRAFDAGSPKVDAWKVLNAQPADTEPVSSEDSEVYPPPNWQKTEDPELRAEYFHAQLIKQFGDIPEVHIVAERERKRARQIPVSLDEQITFLEAQYHLWPSPNTLKTLEKLKKIKADTHTHPQKH
jgi:hypothetical protein